MKFRRSIGLFALLTIVALLVAGCASLQSAGQPDRGAPSQAVAPAAPGAPAGVTASESARRAAPAAAPAAQSNQVGPAVTGERLIVQTANLTLLVDDVVASATRTRELAETLGGFVVTASQREDNGRPIASVVIRVPAERFNEALDRLKEMAVRAPTEQISSKDVTEEFVDTDARLRNLKATEQRYLALLEQARTVDDVLKVEQQLTNIRGQIEQLQGRLQYLERSAETSTINVELRPYALAQAQPSDWNPLPIVRNALAALLNTVQFLIAALIWLVIFTPVWLPLALLVRRWRRSRAARRAAQPPAAAPPAAAGQTPA